MTVFIVLEKKTTKNFFSPLVIYNSALSWTFQLESNSSSLNHQVCEIPQCDLDLKIHSAFLLFFAISSPCPSLNKHGGVDEADRFLFSSKKKRRKKALKSPLIYVCS